jgi:large subunit ribosomal protein L25
MNSPRIPIASVTLTRELKQEEATTPAAGAAPAAAGAAGAPGAPGAAAPAGTPAAQGTTPEKKK